MQSGGTASWRYGVTPMNLKLLAAVLVAGTALATPAMADPGRFEVSCPNLNATLEYDFQRGIQNKPLVNLNPRLVGASCTDSGGIVYKMRGFDAVVFKSEDAIKKFASQVKTVLNLQDQTTGMLDQKR